MAIAYLMRHGAVDNPNHIFYPPEQPLSELGRRQVLATAERLKAIGFRPSKLFASPFLRARQTAEIAAACLGEVPVIFDERLREWAVDGWYGKPTADFYKHVGWIDGAVVTDFPDDIESYQHIAERVSASIREALAAEDGSDVMLISHGEPIACAAAFLQGRPWIEVRTHPARLAGVLAFSFDEGLKQCTVTQVIDTPEV